MMIDERIMCERQMAECWKVNREYCDFNTECSECGTDCEAEEKKHEQLAEWLEELKALKSDNNLIFRDGLEQGYNKAIDDFAEKLKGFIESNMMSRATELETYQALDELVDYDIGIIAEQLKAGK